MKNLLAVFSCQQKPETLIARTEDNADGVDLSESASTRVVIQSLAVYHYYELMNAAADVQVREGPCRASHRVQEGQARRAHRARRGLQHEVPLRMRRTRH